MVTVDNRIVAESQLGIILNAATALCVKIRSIQYTIIHNNRVVVLYRDSTCNISCTYVIENTIVVNLQFRNGCCGVTSHIDSRTVQLQFGFTNKA